MKLFLIISLSLAHTKTISQIYSKGSIAIATICRDGIVIAADTRGAFWSFDDGVVDFDRPPLAYYDTVQKIYRLKNFALCAIGQNTFGFKFTNFYLRQYEKTLNANDSIPINGLGLYPFLSLNYSHIISEFMRVKIITAGYQNNKPTICSHQNGRYQCGSDTAIVYSEKELNLAVDQFVNVTCEKAVPIIEIIIRDYIKQYKKEYTMGGPIMFLKIAPGNKFKWLKNRPRKENYEDIRVFYKEYKMKKVKIHFTSSENKIKFENWMEPLQRLGK